MAPQVRYLEDFEPGQTLEFGSYTLAAEEIVDFARRYDPQPFHLDEAAGRRTHFGGLVASGWQTAAVMMRMFVDHLASPETSLGSPGIDELRWLRPVRPGDTLRVRVTMLEVMRSRSKPDRGTVRQRVEVVNQDDTVVMTLIALGMFRARDTGLGA